MEYMEAKMQERYDASNALVDEMDKLSAQVEALQENIRSIMVNIGAGATLPEVCEMLIGIEKSFVEQEQRPLSKIIAERDALTALIDKHGICVDCGEMYSHDIEEPFASCRTNDMKRYDFKTEYNHVACEDQVTPVEDPKGHWVRYEDAATLLATVEKLRASFSEQTKAFALWMNDFDVLTQELGIESRIISINDLRKHLRDARAEAGRKGYMRGTSDWGVGYQTAMFSAANNYADSIRNAKDGEQQ